MVRSSSCTPSSCSSSATLRLSVCFGIPRSRAAAVKLRASASLEKRRMSSSVNISLMGRYVPFLMDCLVVRRWIQGGPHRLMVRRNITHDLELLKEHLEAQA